MVRSVPPRLTSTYWGVVAVGTFALACAPEGPAPAILEIEASVSSAVATVVELSWSTNVPGASWVEFSTEGGELFDTPVTEVASEQHSAKLYGLPPFTDVSYRAFIRTDNGLASEEGSILTGGIPAALPDFERLEHAPDAVSDEPWLMTAVVGNGNFLVVLNRDGKVVWYRELNPDWADYLVMSVDFHPGERDLLFGAYSREDIDPRSEAVTVGFSGDEVSRRALGSAHHDLVQHDDGTIAILRSDLRTWFDPGLGEDVGVLGDAVVEIAPGGAIEEVFSTWDWSEPWVHDRFYKQGADIADWTHANGLSYDDSSDSYLLSLGNIDTVLQIERGTGAVLRELGHTGYAVQEGTPFTFQHDAHWTSDHTLLMSSSVGDEDRLMAIEYEVDDDEGCLRELWSYGKDEGFTSPAGGQAFRVSNGNTVLNTGYRGLLVEVTPEREPVWEVSSSMGAVFVSAFFFDDFYSRD
jgi:hypothetical protein